MKPPSAMRQTRRLGITVILCGLLVGSGSATAADGQTESQLSAADCQSDLRELVGDLEETHPDPHQACGGRLAFHRRVWAISQQIPAVGMTASAFLRLVRPLVAGVGDGHTSITSPLINSRSQRV